MAKNKMDLITIFAKGGLGSIPFIGPLAAEVAGTLIPNQRIDRIESLLKILEEKLKEKDKCRVKEKIKTAESIDLIEDAFIQASRSLSDDRKEYIASLLKNSLTQDDLNHIEYKRLLSLLGELNDLEILLLISKRFSRMCDDDPEEREFMEKHGDMLREPVAYMGGTQEEFDKHTLFKSHQLNMVRLGVLQPRFKRYKKGEIPEFDEKTGMIKASGYDTTSLGRLLLKSIDQGDN